MIHLEKIAEWRERADDYDRRAKLNRRAGDPVYAEELEAVAVDLRLACDELEAITCPYWWNRGDQVFYACDAGELGHDGPHHPCHLPADFYPSTGWATRDEIDRG